MRRPRPESRDSPFRSPPTHIRARRANSRSYGDGGRPPSVMTKHIIIHHSATSSTTHGRAVVVLVVIFKVGHIRSTGHRSIQRPNHQSLLGHPRICDPGRTTCFCCLAPGGKVEISSVAETLKS